MKIILYVMVISYILIFSHISINRIDNYDGMSAFDLAIPDQGIWLMSNLKDPFVTVRGLHLFGDHTPYIYILFVPLYWIFNSIKVLAAIQTIAIAVGAIGIYLVAEKTLKDKYSPLICAALYLLQPATNFLNTDLLFSDAFATPLLIFAYYFMITQRYSLSFGSSFLALMCKEDVAVTVLAFAAYAFITKHRRFAIALGVTAMAFFAINMSVMLPHFNGFGYFRNLYGYNAMGKLGPNPQTALIKIANDPRLPYDILATEDNKNYLLNMLGPLAFLPLLSLSAIMFAPQLIINIMSGYYYTHYIAYHYTAYVIPFMMIAFINALSNIKRLKILGLLAAIIATIYFSTSIGGPYNMIKDRSYIMHSFDNKSAYVRNLDRMVDEIPINASASVSYMFLTHMAHRNQIYMFPNPFRYSYWGINGENLPDIKPDYLLIDDSTNNEKSLLQRLINGTYDELDSKDGITIYKKHGDVG